MLMLLIEGERLKSLIEQSDVDVYQGDLLQWKASVETFMQQTTAHQLTPEARAGVQRLQALTDEIRDALSHLSHGLAKQLSSAGKQHHGAQKYMSNSGDAF
jgi:hypothetical protein